MNEGPPESQQDGASRGFIKPQRSTLGKIVLVLARGLGGVVLLLVVLVGLVFFACSHH